MKLLIRLIGRVLKYGTFLSTLGFVGCILLQIFARLLLPTAPSWTEEAARLFFVLAMGCAAGLALRSGEYVNFDFVYQRLNTAWQRRLDLFIDLFTVVLFVIFTFGAVRFTIMGWAERSPGLKFPMAVAFVSMLILGLSVLVYAVDKLLRQRRTTENSPGR